ncbi:MAG TPA: FG-GAP-like repeat-containing protein, partial [Jatrophihabitantaceae bacterium]
MRILKTSAIVFAGLAVTTTSAFAAAGRPDAGSVTAERLKVPSGPSSIRGLADEPSVDPFHAQLEYEVPIEMPGGLGGLAPKLALSYSGALGNGPLGIGWTLAQPRIQRSTRFGVPKFNDADELEISGVVAGRLVAIGGDEYRVEGMGQTVRVRRSGAGFEVDDGKGVHYRFGMSAAARQEKDPTRTVAWLVEDEVNLMGERIAYEYAHDQNEVYLSGIAWGPGGRYRADLGYEARADVVRSYRAGFLVVSARRLATIRISAAGVERRAYQLSYDETLSVARLKGVTSTGKGGAGAWPPLAFTYATPGAPAIEAIAGIGTWRLNGNGTTLVDLDGDGAAELLQVSSTGHRYLTNQNGTFTRLQSLAGNSQPLSAVQLQDVDGDARAELIEDTASGWKVYKFTRTTWSTPVVWPGTAGVALKNEATTRFADLNGDGLVDAIQWNNDGLQVRFASRQGLGAAQGVERIGGAVLPTASGRFHDTNGDGLDDFFVVGSDHLDVYVGRGDGSFDPAIRVSYPFAGTIGSIAEIELVDLDRDGLMDLLKIESGTVKWFPGLANGSFGALKATLANPEPLTSNVVVAVADTNGNGSQDVVWSSASGMWRLDLAGATTAGMLTQVSNGLGMEVAFDYRSAHALAVEAALAGSAWGSLVPIAMPVPVKKTTALGPGETTRVVGYSVRDGVYDAVERRFAGFLTTIVTTAGATAAETGSVITRHLIGNGNDRVLRGRPQTVQVFNGAGKRLSFVTNTWATQAVAGLPDVPLLRRAVLKRTVTQYDDTSVLRFTDVKYGQDGLGRTTHAVDCGRTDVVVDGPDCGNTGGAGDEAVTDTTYADDDATWVRDVVCEEKVSSTGGVVASQVQHLFGDAERVEALCVAGKGWPRAT